MHIVQFFPSPHGAVFSLNSFYFFSSCDVAVGLLFVCFLFRVPRPNYRRCFLKLVRHRYGQPSGNVEPFVSVCSIWKFKEKTKEISDGFS